jgi:hypothetical protein
LISSRATKKNVLKLKSFTLEHVLAGNRIFSTKKCRERKLVSNVFLMKTTFAEKGKKMEHSNSQEYFCV